MMLNLISGPRNVSTALMYAFAQRTDTVVFDEPFYAVYLARSGVIHPGRDAVLQSLPADEDVVRSALSASHEKPVSFIKNMAHHMEVLDNPFVDEAINIFLIRDPYQILASYAEVIEQPVMRDVGIAFQYRLFHALVQEGLTPIVVDAGFLLENPAKVLRKLCETVGLPFEQCMTRWSPGPKPYDGVWAPHWYVNVHNTTGFNKQATSSRPLPQHLHNLCAEARQFYEKLLPFSLKA